MKIKLLYQKLLELNCSIFPGEIIYTPCRFTSQSDDKKFEYSEWYVGEPKQVQSVAIDDHGNWFVYLYGSSHFGSAIIEGTYALDNFKSCEKTKCNCESLVKKLNEREKQ